jgi:hypothetical protein
MRRRNLAPEGRVWDERREGGVGGYGELCLNTRSEEEEEKHSPKGGATENEDRELRTAGSGSRRESGLTRVRRERRSRAARHVHPRNRRLRSANADGRDFRTECPQAPAGAGGLGAPREALPSEPPGTESAGAGSHKFPRRLGSAWGG